MIPAELKERAVHELVTLDYHGKEVKLAVLEDVIKTAYHEGVLKGAEEMAKAFALAEDRRRESQEQWSVLDF